MAQGIRLVEDGEYDAAILMLDNAARRLARDRGSVRDLSQAYLNLGIAYLGKGYESNAKARFRQALALTPDLVLGPEKHPAKVIELFERAKEEAKGQAAPKPAASPETRKGGTGKGLVVLGLGAAAVAGVALSARSTRKTETFAGVLPPVLGQHNREYAVTVGAAGQLDATLTWSEPAAILSMQLYETDAGNPVARGVPVGTGRSQLSAAVTPKTYTLGVFQCVPGTPCANLGTSTSNATYTLTILHP